MSTNKWLKFPWKQVLILSSIVHWFSYNVLLKFKIHIKTVALLFFINPHRHSKTKYILKIKQNNNIEYLITQCVKSFFPEFEKNLHSPFLMNSIYLKKFRILY